MASFIWSFETPPSPGIRISSQFPCYFSLRVSSVFDHFGYPAPPLGDWLHAKWYNLRLVQETLESMQHRVSNGMTPLPSLQVPPTVPRAAPTAAQGSSSSREAAAPGRAVRPVVAQKSPRSAAGRAQVASAAQKRGSGEGSKGIRLEDSQAPTASKRRRQPKPSATVSPIQPSFEDTFEESEDSDASCDGPFPGSSTAAAASSTTVEAPLTPQ